MVVLVQTGDALMTLKQESAKRQKVSPAKKEKNDPDATDDDIEEL
jgi:hypothetical protein